MSKEVSAAIRQREAEKQRLCLKEGGLQGCSDMLSFYVNENCQMQIKKKKKREKNKNKNKLKKKKR